MPVPTRIAAPQRTTGRTAPRPLQRGATTSPQAAAILALQRSAGNRATRSLMRQPTHTVPAPWPTEDAGPGPEAPAKITTYSADGDVATVHMSDGSRWEVTRERSTVPVVKKRGQLSGGFGADLDRVWMKVSWCQGTRGEIRIGGNPQGAAKDVLEGLAKGIVDGGDGEKVKQVLAGAEIAPFIDWDIQRPGEWKITGEVVLTFDKEGLKKAGGKLGVEKGPFGGSIEGTGDRDGGWNVTVQGNWTPRGSTKTKGPCPLDELYFPYAYKCVRARDFPATVKPVKKHAEDKYTEHRFVYFKYASDEVNPRLSPKADLDALEGLMGAGYKVVNVQAFTSPEGLRDPSARWKEGNTALATRRAQAAMHVAAEHCLDGGCITGKITPPTDVELLPLDFENLEHPPSEGSGKALEDHVIREWDDAISDDIKEQKTPAADKRVKAARGRHAKAKVIYEYLRRARIDFEKVEVRDWIENETVDAYTKRTSGNCPEEILDAARNAWKKGGLGN